MPTPRSFLWKWYLCGLLLVHGACTRPHTVQPPVTNPMDASWSRIRDGINKLEDQHANEDDWRKASESQPKLVSSISDLQDQTKDFQITASERQDLPAAFNKSSRVMHFEFECNYHALVFFNDAGKSWKVIKW